MQMSQQKNKTKRRNGKAAKMVLQSLKDLKEDPVPGVDINTVEDDIYNWDVTVNGPDNSPYRDGKFHLSVKFKNRFPIQAPEFKMITPIYHMNINIRGMICLDKIATWDKKYTMRDVLSDIVELFENPSTNDPLVDQLTVLYCYNKERYNRNAYLCTQLYACGQDDEDDEDDKDGDKTPFTMDLFDNVANTTNNNDNNNNDNNHSNDRNLTITNLSPDTTVFVLVEREKKHKKRNNRSAMLKEIVNSESPMETAKSAGFDCIQGTNDNDKRNHHTYDNARSGVWVTCINLTIKKLVHYQHYVRSEHLYFIHNELKRLTDFRPQCDNPSPPHLLMRTIDYGKQYTCTKCSTTHNEVYYCCNSCKLWLCSTCCHLKMCQKYANLKLNNKDNLMRSRIATEISRFSLASSVAPPCTISNALIVVLRIGKYNGQTLELRGVAKNYKGLLNVFSKVWNYKVFYWVNKKGNNDNETGSDDMNESIYTNDIKRIENNSNFKLEWNGNEIKNFVEQARKHVVKNKHDGLIFIVAGHAYGDGNKMLIDSQAQEYPLASIYSMFTPRGRPLVESYKEEQKESLQLLRIPKIFCIDIHRGKQQAEATKTETEQEPKKANETDEKEMEYKHNEKQHEKAEKHRKQEKEKPQGQDQNKKNTTGKTNNEEDKNEQKEEKVEEKHKDSNPDSERNELHITRSNFYKLHATVESDDMIGDDESGGGFAKNLAQLFNDEKFVLENDWSTVVSKLREYTKRDDTSLGLGDLDESTLEYVVKFAVNKKSTDEKDEKYDGIQKENKAKM